MCVKVQQALTQPKPKPWDVMDPEPPGDTSLTSSPTQREPCLKLLKSVGPPKTLDARTNLLPARSMSPLEIIEASREGLKNFDPNGRWYRPDAADDFQMSSLSDIDKWRANQSDLYADLDAKVASRETEKAKKLEQLAERKRTNAAFHRIRKSASMGAIEKPWTYCDAPNSFQPPIVDNSESRNSVKNHFLTGMWNGLEGMRPPHHECNVHGGWNYSSNDCCKGLEGTFQPVPSQRMSIAEKKTAKILQQRISQAQDKVQEDARRATVGTEKRSTILLNAEKFSVNSGEAQPWVTQRVSTHSVFVNDRPLVSACEPGVDIYLDGDIKAQVTQTRRAHDHARNFIGGNGGPSKWKAPAGALVGTRRRQDTVEALIRRRDSQSLPAASSKERRVMFGDPEPQHRGGVDRTKQKSKPESVVKTLTPTELAAEAKCRVIDFGPL